MRRSMSGSRPRSGVSAGQVDDKAATAPVRGVVAMRRIHRGEHLCTIKREAILTGERATVLLRRVCSSFAQISPTHASTASAEISRCTAASPFLSLRPYEDILKDMAKLPTLSADPMLFLSRDAMLITAAIYLLRSPLHRGALASSAGDPLLSWAAALPPRTPPLALLLRSHFAARKSFEPLRRHVQLGHHSTPVPPELQLSSSSSPSAAQALSDAVMQAVETGQYSLATLPSPQLQVSLSAEIKQAFLKGQTPALTQRQFESGPSKRTVEQEANAVDLFVEMERTVEQQCIARLLSLLLSGSDAPAWSPGQTVEDGDALRLSDEAAVMRWSHFMARSRVVNVHAGDAAAAPRMGVVPFVDLLNHSGDGANVRYCTTADGDVSVTATRSVEPGEELVLQYGNVRQRGCLFGERSRREQQQHHQRVRGAIMGGAKGPVAPPQGGGVAADVRKIERRQFHDFYSRDDDDGSGDGEEAGELTADVEGTKDEAARGRAEARREMQWLWRYGFLRSAAEKDREAAQLWSSSLRRRVAHLTDARCKGRPGSFVVAVPEGLRHLREQREELERDRYNRQPIFPPQQL